MGENAILHENLLLTLKHTLINTKTMGNLVQNINTLLGQRSLLQHPFYLLWSEGKLTLSALAGYAKEYYQLVKAVPTCVGEIAKVAPDAAQTALRLNQAEEHSHIALWEDFTSYVCHTVGIDAELDTYVGLEKTRAAVAQFKALCTGYAEGSAAMYAFEKALPEISTTKLEGLQQFYGITDTAATTYFNVHAVVDIIHAEAWAEVLQTEPDTLISTAAASLDSQHLLLDACYEAYC